MLNFVIDTSVFALPDKSSDPETEKNNLCSLRDSLFYLYSLQMNDTITVSYMNGIYFNLKNNKYPFRRKDINDRIKDLLAANPEYQTEIAESDIMFNRWTEIMSRMTNHNKDPITDKLKKGKLGIFNNIPDRDSDPSYEYTHKSTFTGGYNYCPNLPLHFKNIFTKYCGYIADLNQKYACSGNNFVVLGESSVNLEKKDFTVTLGTYIPAVNSQIAIVGINKTAPLCPPNPLDFKNLVTACDKAQNNYSEKLIFGKNVDRNNIQKDLLPMAGSPQKVYYCLQTLHDISDIITKNNVNTNDDSVMVEFFNSHGLLSSTDKDKYRKSNCTCRTFENESGKKLFFNIHLKPSTYTNYTPDEDDDESDKKYTMASKNTVRIYVCWDNGKNRLLIGWIGHHSPSCKDCTNTKCQSYPKKVFAKIIKDPPNPLSP